MRATSRHLQPAHGAFAGREFVGRKTQSLEHGEVEIGERVIICGVKGQMLAVLETAAREHHGQVHVRVRIRAAHWRAVKNHRAVEQRLVFFLRRGERGEETVQGIELFLLVPAQFGQHLGAIAVMGDVVDHGRVDEE